MNLLFPYIKKIAVFRALQLGDLLCFIPAIKALRCAYPEAEIILLGLPWSEILLERFPAYFDRFIHFPGYTDLPEQEFNKNKFDDFVEKIKNENIDLLLQMQGNGTVVNRMLQQFQAKYIAGFSPEENNNLFIKYPDRLHEVQRHLKLMEHLGINSVSPHLEFPLYEKDEKDLELLSFHLQPKKYICVHPGSRGEWRQWPPEYFARLADHFAEKDFTVVITGTSSEKNITEQVIKNMHHEAIDATGKTTLGAMGVLLKNSFMLISNCTGASHIASALDVPSLIISMDSEPFRWKPMNNEISITIDWTKEQDFNTVINAAKQLHHQLKSENK